MKSILYVAILFMATLGCADDDDGCTTCELAGTSVELCPDDLESITAQFGAVSVSDAISVIENQGGTCSD